MMRATIAYAIEEEGGTLPVDAEEFAERLVSRLLPRQGRRAANKQPRGGALGCQASPHLNFWYFIPGGQKTRCLPCIPLPPSFVLPHAPKRDRAAAKLTIERIHNPH